MIHGRVQRIYFTALLDKYALKAALYQPEEASNTVAANISRRCIPEHVHLLRNGYRQLQIPSYTE
jgi:hypothetical protein